MTTEMTRDEQRIYVHGIAAALRALRSEEWHLDAKFTGNGWTNWRLAGPGHASLTVTIGGYRLDGKVQVKGNYPKTERSSPRVYEITATASRGPVAVAKEINRRILGAGYVDELLLVLYANEEHADAEAAELVTLGKVAALFGQQAPEDPTNGVRVSDWLAGTGQVKTYGGWESVTIELRGVPTDVALRMLAVLAREGKRSA